MIRDTNNNLTTAVRVTISSLLCVVLAQAQTGGWQVSIPGPTCYETYLYQFQAGPYGCWTSAECVSGIYYRDIYGIMGSAGCDCQWGATINIQGYPTPYSIRGSGEVLPTAIEPFPVYEYNVITCDLKTMDTGNTAYVEMPEC